MSLSPPTTGERLPPAGGPPPGHGADRFGLDARRAGVPGDGRDRAAGRHPAGSAAALGARVARPETTVLVVDAVPGHRGAAIEIAAVATLVSHLGVRASTADGRDALDEVRRTQPRAVVLVLHPSPEARGRHDLWAETWEAPARLTGALVQGGTDVIALSMWASAAALAWCVEEGALGVMHVDQLPGVLGTVLARPATRHPHTGAHAHRSGERAPLPPPFHTLVRLTASERHVLFHMTEGRSAAEIASALVVSVSTVRSHIRAVLRKLQVTTQLAAVAIANGIHPEDLAAPPLP